MTTPEDPHGPARPRQWRAQLDGWLTTAMTVASVWLYVDLVTGGQARRYARQMLTRSASALRPPAVEPSPPELSALQEEARRITREAAPDG